MNHTSSRPKSVKSVKVPTHEYGHSLDLVLSYGISLGYMNVCDATFSDHNLVIFGISVC